MGTWVRIIIMLIIFFSFFLPLMGKVRNIILPPSMTDDSVREIIKEINNMDTGSNPSTVSLDKSSAIIGFSKGMDFQCIGCGTNEKGQLSSVMKRPADPECADSACVCSCQNPPASPTGKLLEITCSKLACTKINHDIYPNIKAGELFVSKIGSYKYTYGNSEWKGGFIYIRDAGEMDQVMTGIRKNFEIRTELYLEKKELNGKIYVALCPNTGCINQLDTAAT